MFFNQNKLTKVKNSKSTELDCNICEKETKHSLFKFPYGPGVGIPFISSAQTYAFAKYYLICNRCSNPSKEISKDVAKAYMTK